MASSEKATLSQLLEQMKLLKEEMRKDFAEAAEEASSLEEKIDRSNKSIEERYETNNTKVTALSELIGKFESRIDKVESVVADLIEQVKHVTIALEKVSDIEKSQLALKEEVDLLSKRQEKSEQYSRMMNLWVYGWEEKEKEDTMKAFFTLARDCLQLSVQEIDKLIIRDVHRVGKKGASPRPIIVELVTSADRELIYKSASKLQKVNENRKFKLSIKTDLAPMARKRRQLYHRACTRLEKDEEERMFRVCYNERGHVWIVQKVKGTKRWVKWEKILQIYLQDDFESLKVKPNQSKEEVVIYYQAGKQDKA